MIFLQKKIKALRKSYTVLLAFLFVCNVSLIAQKKGKVEIIVQDSRITTLVEKHIAFNESRGCINGFRIQIFFDSGNNSKSNAVSTLSVFKAKHPEVGAYLSFQEPNYKVRVGDYRTRMDAQRFLHKITDDIPNAFIVKDNAINYPCLEDEKEKDEE